MNSPFSKLSDNFNWRDAFWGVSVAAMGYLPNQAVKDVVKAAPYNVADCTWAVKQGDYSVNIVFVDAGETVYVGIEGTTNFIQIVSFILRDGFVYPFNDARGIFKVFWDAGFSSFLDVKTRVPKSKAVVLTGHSLGGAAAVVAAKLLKDDGYDVKVVLTIGQPYTGNAAWASSYTVPLYRIFHPADIVQKVPWLGSAFDVAQSAVMPRFLFGNWYADRGLEHMGERVVLDEEGSADDADFYMSRLRELGTPQRLGPITGHLVGNYLGLLYKRLSDSDKFFFKPLAEELTKSGSFTLYDAAFPSRDPNAVQLTEAQIRAEEQAFGASLIGPQSKARVRLFKGPYIAPSRGNLPALTEADFPGYAPQRPPATALVRGGAPDVARVGPVTITFEATAPPSPSQRIAGAQVTYLFDDGVERLVEAFPFAEEIVVRDQGQQISLTVEASLARFGD